MLLKYKLLEFQSIPRADLQAWMQATPYCAMLMQRCYPQATATEAFDALLQDLVRSGAADVRGDLVRNT